MGKVKVRRRKNSSIEKRRIFDESVDREATLSQGKDGEIFQSKWQDKKSLDFNPFKSASNPSFALKKFDSKTKRTNRVERPSKFLSNCIVSKRNALRRSNCRFGKEKDPVYYTGIFTDQYEKCRRKEEELNLKVLADYKDIKDSLPTLDQLEKEIKHKNGEGKPRAAKSLSRQKAEMIQDIHTYQQVLNSDLYNSDPFTMITSQLQHRLQSGNL